MRLLIALGLLLGVFLVGIPWAKGHFDDAGFRQDMAMTPGLLDRRKGASAGDIAAAVKASAVERGITLPDDGLRVQVSASRKGSYKVAGGIMRVTAGGVTSVQDVTIDATYDRPVLKVFKRHVQTQVVTMQPG